MTTLTARFTGAFAALALAAGALIAGTAAPAHAVGGSIDTGTIVKPKYKTYSSTVYIPVSVSGLDSLGSWNYVSVRPTNGSYAISGTVDSDDAGYTSNGTIKVPVDLSYNAVKAGHLDLGLYFNGYLVSQRRIKVIGQPQVTHINVYGVTKKKSKKTVSGSVQYFKDVAGKWANVYFDAKGGKKKYAKVASAKIGKDGWFKTKTKKKLGKGTFQVRIKASSYTRAANSFKLTWKK